jgi:hypothetical protein
LISSARASSSSPVWSVMRWSGFTVAMSSAPAEWRGDDLRAHGRAHGRREPGSPLASIHRSRA